MPVTDVQQDLNNLTLTITDDFAAPVQRIWQVYADPRQLEKVLGAGLQDVYTFAAGGPFRTSGRPAFANVASADLASQTSPSSFQRSRFADGSITPEHYRFARRADQARVRSTISNASAETHAAASDFGGIGDLLTMSRQSAA